MQEREGAGGSSGRSGGAEAVDPESGARQNEMLHLTKYTPLSSYYGVPDMLPAVAAVLGDKAAREYNVDFFSHNAVPRMAIIVEGGQLSEEVLEQLRQFMESEVKGQGHKTLVLDVPGRETRVRLEKLTVGRHRRRGVPELPEGEPGRGAAGAPSATGKSDGSGERQSGQQPGPGQDLPGAGSAARAAADRVPVQPADQRQLGIGDWAFRFREMDLTEAKEEAEVAAVLRGDRGVDGGRDSGADGVGAHLRGTAPHPLAASPLRPAAVSGERGGRHDLTPWPTTDKAKRRERQIAGDDARVSGSSKRMGRGRFWNWKRSDEALAKSARRRAVSEGKGGAVDLEGLFAGRQRPGEVMRFTGVASSLGRDRQGERMTEQALAQMAKAGTVPLLARHGETAQAIGTVERMWVEAGRLHVEGGLEAADPVARELWRRLRRGERRGSERGRPSEAGAEEGRRRRAGQQCGGWRRLNCSMWRCANRDWRRTGGVVVAVRGAHPPTPSPVES